MSVHVYTTEPYRNIQPGTGRAFDVIPPHLDGYTWALHSWKVSQASGVLILMWEGTPTPTEPERIDLETDPDDCDCRGCRTGTGCVLAFSEANRRPYLEKGGFVDRVVRLTCEGMEERRRQNITPEETQAFVDSLRLDRDTEDQGDETP